MAKNKDLQVDSSCLTLNIKNPHLYYDFHRAPLAQLVRAADS